MQAVFIRCLTYYKGDMRLYRLSTPVSYSGYNANGGTTVMQTEYVIVTSVSAEAYSLAETLIYPANDDGKLLSRINLPGSYRGGLDHKEALTRAGYELQE